MQPRPDQPNRPAFIAAANAALDALAAEQAAKALGTDGMIEGHLEAIRKVGAVDLLIGWQLVASTLLSTAEQRGIARMDLLADVKNLLDQAAPNRDSGQ